jgi:hypothetical protein
MRLVWNQCVDAITRAPSLPFYRAGSNGLFKALDGRTLIAGRSRWLVEVYSIFAEAGSIWLQIGLAGESTYNVLLRMASADGADHAVRYLSSWLLNPADRSHVFNVA